MTARDINRYIKEAAKFWIAVGGGLVTAAVAQFALPDWVTYVAGLLTTVAVYIVPNAERNDTRVEVAPAQVVDSYDIPEDV